MKVVWSDRALRSLADIHSHISADSRDAAHRTVDAILKRGDRLDRFPRLGRIVNRRAHTVSCIECVPKPSKSSRSFTQRSCLLGSADCGLAPDSADASSLSSPLHPRLCLQLRGPATLGKSHSVVGNQRIRHRFGRGFFEDYFVGELHHTYPVNQRFKQGPTPVAARTVSS